MRALKAALLDQRTLAGLGNIYVDEALWYAKLHPQRPAGSLDRDELRRLHRAIRKALELGIVRQGSTLTDYRLPDGSSGSMQKEFKAYGRDDEPCDRCGTLLAKTRVAGRGTWFCPHCQTSRRGDTEGPGRRRAPRDRRGDGLLPLPGFSLAGLSRPSEPGLLGSWLCGLRLRLGLGWPWPSRPWPSRPWPSRSWPSWPSPRARADRVAVAEVCRHGGLADGDRACPCGRSSPSCRTGTGRR